MKRFLLLALILTLTLTYSPTLIFAEEDSSQEISSDELADEFVGLTDDEILDELFGLSQCGKRHFPLCIHGTCSGGKVCLPKINLTDPRKNTCSCQPVPKPRGTASAL